MFKAGQEIKEYTLIRKLGKGAFGEVWLAEKRSKFLTTQVAIKLPTPDMLSLEAFQQEVQIWKQASGHQNVLPIIEADESNGQIFIASEFAPNGSLDEQMKINGVYQVVEAVHLTIDILKGLEYLHTRQPPIIHRDIKPANILMQGTTPRLADFGIARLMQTEVLTKTIAGTYPYMSPESFDGQRGKAMDIWAVGVILYQLLSGNLPFPQTTAPTLLNAILHKNPEPLRDEIPLDLQKIIQRALAKKPSERYQTAKSMGDDLQLFSILHVNHKMATGGFNLSTPPEIGTLANISVKRTDSLSKQNSLPENLKNPNFVKVVEKNVSISASSPSPLPVGIAESVEKIESAPPESPVVKPSSRRNISFVVLSLVFAGIIIGFGALLALSILPKRFPVRDRLTEVVANLQTEVDKAVVSVNKQIESIPTPTPAIVTEVKLEMCQREGKWGFCDENSNEIIKAKYDLVEPFQNDLAKVRLQGKEGFIDKKGDEKIPLKYNQIMNFNEGLAIVELNGKFGFINSEGKEIIPPIYDQVTSFMNDRASVSLGDKIFYIDRNGKKISEK